MPLILVLTETLNKFAWNPRGVSEAAPVPTCLLQLCDASPFSNCTYPHRLRPSIPLGFPTTADNICGNGAVVGAHWGRGGSGGGTCPPAGILLSFVFLLLCVMWIS